MASHIKWNAKHSSFASVLGTNHSPSPAELDQLKASLIEPQSELRRLESEIARQQAILDELLTEKNTIETFVEAHKALMSPIRQIPAEILTEIFVWCLPEPYGLRSSKHAPLILTTVSRDWRRIALDTPKLWRSLHIYFPDYLDEKDTSCRIDGVAAWLKRSCTLPISLSLHAGVSYPYSVDDVQISKAKQSVVLLIESLMPFSERIQHMYLSLTPEAFHIFSTVLASPGPAFPILTSLKLGDYPVNGGPILLPNDGVPHYALLLAHMPSLQSLEISKHADTASNITYHAFPCRWASLTSLSMEHSIRATQLLGILAQTPLLQFLKGSIFTEPNNSEHLVELTHLTSLRLRIQSSPFDPDPSFVPMDPTMEVSVFFHQIVCSSLKSLYITFYSWRPINRLPCASMPLHNLEELGLEVSMTPSALTEYLPMVPNLLSLDVVDVGLGGGAADLPMERFGTTLQDSHFSTLSSVTDVGTFLLCPRLQRFRMMDRFSPWDYDNNVVWSSETLLTFLHARASSSILNSCSLFLHEPRHLSEEDTQRLRLLKNHQIKIQLHQYRNKDMGNRGDEPTAGLFLQTPPLAPGTQTLTWATLADMDRTFDDQVML